MNKILTFSGHRSDKLADGVDKNEKYRNFNNEFGIYYVKMLMCDIEELYIEGYNHLRFGGALGFDTVAALAGIIVKEKKYHDLILEMCIPCRNQEKLWSARDRERYWNIIGEVDILKVVTDEPYSIKRGGYLMQKRNMYMADGADGYISCWDGSKGGTKNFIDYANKINLNQIKNYDPVKVIEEMKGIL